MKLLSFTRNGTASYGAKLGDGVVDLGLRFGARWPTLGTALKAQGLKALENACKSGADFALSEVRLLPAITDPDKIICVGMNYKSHVAEMGREPPVKPAMFTRFANTIVGSGDAMVRPAASDQYDFEGEFAFVIGKPARHIKAANAFDVIAGYTCFHDGSIRDWQNHTTQFLAGKNFPRTGAMGPWMTTRDEVPDPGRLVLQTRLNGETVQRAPISDLVFGIPELIEYITTAMELAPGDVIATGTPGGVGAGRKPQLWMKPGDQVEVEIDAIGILSNHIFAEE